jgi:hypothetical protein
LDEFSYVPKPNLDASALDSSHPTRAPDAGPDSHRVLHTEVDVRIMVKNDSPPNHPQAGVSLHAQD